MKIIHYILILVTLSCNDVKQTGKTISENEKEVSAVGMIDNSNYYLSEDTVVFSTGTEIVIKYPKDYINQTIDKHPEFFGDYTQDPDQLYYCYASDSKEFGSEIGQDNYYVLYAYFLRQKYDLEKYEEQRKKLISIYSIINSLFQHFQHGGTYFGHQYSRILGYAEYSIYFYHETNFDIKAYDITKHKELYIKSLRLLIEDEARINVLVLTEKNRKRIKKLNKMVDELDHLITGNYFLRRAQEFHYRHYQYY